MGKKKRVFLNNLDIFIFAIVMSVKLLTYGLQIEEQYYSYLVSYPPIIASILIICGIAFLFEKKKRGRFLYTANIILSSLIVSDLVYYGYYKDVLSIPVIQNGAMLGSVKSSVISLFKWQYFLYYIDIFVRPSVIYKYIPDKESTARKRLTSFAIAFFIGVAGTSGFIYIMSVQQPRLITTMYNRLYIAENLGCMNYHILDVYDFFYRAVQKNTPLSASKEKEIKDYFASNVPQGVSVLKGTGQGKNLIIIQVEALQQFVINKSINGQEITPNLNAWLKRSAYFDNYYYQVAAGNTSDAELMTNNSLYPALEGAAAYLYCGDEFNSLPKALEKKGYTTSTLHGFREDFWNRSVMNKAEGYETFYGQRSFKIDEKVGMGLSDKSFLTQSENILKNQKQPYFSFLITLSSHYPFDDVKHYGKFNVGEYEGTLLGNYIKGIHYTDEQLGMFLKKLDEDGITKNSIIAIYGDHYAIPKNEEKNLYKLLNITDGNELKWMELQKVPLIMHFPDDANKGVYHTFTGEMDLYPTIANLYNLPTNYLLGKDMFNAKDGSVVFRNGSFTDGKIFYLSQYNKFYDVSTGKIIPESDELDDKKKNAQKMLEYSDDVLNHNLLKEFNKKSK